MRQLANTCVPKTRIMMMSVDIDDRAMGSQELGVRSEPDESYNLGIRKPYPDLVIEVIITSGGVDKLEGYRRMGVAEVWFWEDGVLSHYHLKADGSTYEKVARSVLLPDLPIEIFCRYITYHDQFDAVDDFLVALATWVMFVWNRLLQVQKGKLAGERVEG